MKYYFKIILSAIIVCIILWYLTRHYSLKDLGNVILHINWWMLIGGLIATGFIYIVSGLRWHYLFPQYPITTSINGTTVAFAANTIIPARGGEIVRALYLKSRNKIPISQTIGCIILERLLDGISLIIFLALAIIILGDTLGRDAKMILIIGVLLLVIIGLVLISYIIFSKKIDPVLKQIGIRLHIPIKIIQAGKKFLEVYKKMSTLKFFLSIFISIIISFFFILSLWLFLNSCDIPITFEKAIVVYPLITLSISIPITIGYVGIYDTALIAALILVGIYNNQLFWPVIVVHLLTIVPVTIYGWLLLYFQYFNKSLLTRNGNGKI